MGVWKNCKGRNMLQQVLTSSLVVLAQAAPQVGKGLPVLFQFSHPTHNVAVFRGAALKQAIAAGVVKGFGSLGSDSDSDAANAGAEEDRDGRSDDGEGEGAGSYAAPPTTTAPPPPPPTTTTPPPPPPTTQAYVAPVTVAPTSPAPAPVVYRPAPVYKPVVYKPAPVVYKPAPVVYKPAPVAYKPAATYKPYVDQYADVPAVYTWGYAVQDDYTSNNFGAKE